MTPKQLGHRDAAQGATRATVNNLMWKIEYDKEFDAVEEFRKKGLDPNGHEPAMPRMCARATRENPAVCNCCSACSTTCWTEKFDGVTVGGLVKGLFKKLLW